MTGEHRATPRSRVTAWIAALLWTALVLTASGEAFSADATRGFVYEIWAWLGVSRSDAAPYMFWTRKAAHFVEYAVLAVLLLRALRLTGFGLAAASGCALLLALAVATADEANQARLASRTGSVRDVAIDWAGAATATALTACFAARRKRE